ncbi:MAG: hypothetical protein IJV87_04630, partial [Clostridia bacterium]|nr:hypothetical protein [Clostridia bacterium]
IDNDDAEVYSDEELEKLATAVLNKKDSSGVMDNLAYYRADKGGYTLVTFMDNTVLSGSMSTLFRYTLIFGCIAIVVLFFLARYLAKRIVAPLEESYQKQKHFISDAGHELKTPISVVNASLTIRLFKSMPKYILVCFFAGVFNHSRGACHNSSPKNHRAVSDRLCGYR